MIDPTKPLGVTDIAACVTVERAFLATLLEAPHRVGDCLLWGASSLWFTDPTCARVWSAVEALTAQSIPCDLALVEATVSDFRNASPAARDFAHVSELVRFGMNPCYLKHYASTLRRFAAERQAAGIAHGILSNPNDATSAEDYAASVTHGAGLLLNVAGSVLAEEATDPASRVQRAAADALGASQRKPGIRTGISGIDFMLRGIRAGENLVVGARPGVGKSAFAVTVCLNVMHADPEAAIFYASAEMPVGEVLKRMLSGMSNVSVERVMRSEALSSPSRPSLESCSFSIVGVSGFLISFRWVRQLSHNLEKRSDENGRDGEENRVEPRISPEPSGRTGEFRGEPGRTGEVAFAALETG